LHFNNLTHRGQVLVLLGQPDLKDSTDLLTDAYTADGDRMDVLTEESHLELVEKHDNSESVLGQCEHLIVHFVPLKNELADKLRRLNRSGTHHMLVIFL